jgi:hypothetical protein
MKLPETHDLVTLIGALAVTAFIFIYPDRTGVLLDIAGAFSIINGGQMLGSLGMGGKRWMQGGTLAPDTIVPPAAPETQSHPLEDSKP